VAKIIRRHRAPSRLRWQKLNPGRLALSMLNVGRREIKPRYDCD